MDFVPILDRGLRAKSTPPQPSPLLRKREGEDRRLLQAARKHLLCPLPFA
jgi:hypothetical protein